MTRFVLCAAAVLMTGLAAAPQDLSCVRYQKPIIDARLKQAPPESRDRLRREAAAIERKVEATVQEAVQRGEHFKKVREGLEATVYSRHPALRQRLDELNRKIEDLRRRGGNAEEARKLQIEINRFNDDFARVAWSEATFDNAAGRKLEVQRDGLNRVERQQILLKDSMAPATRQEQTEQVKALERSLPSQDHVRLAREGVTATGQLCRAASLASQLAQGGQLSSAMTHEVAKGTLDRVFHDGEADQITACLNATGRAINASRANDFVSNLNVTHAQEHMPPTGVRVEWAAGRLGVAPETRVEVNKTIAHAAHQAQRSKDIMRGLGEAAKSNPIEVLPKTDGPPAAGAKERILKSLKKLHDAAKAHLFEGAE